MEVNRQMLAKPYHVQKVKEYITAQNTQYYNLLKNLTPDETINELTVVGLKVDQESFDILVDQLKKIVGEYKIKYSLAGDKLNVRLRPGVIHGAVSGAFNGYITYWANNNRPPSPNPPLICLSDAFYNYGNEKR